MNNFKKFPYKKNIQEYFFCEGSIFYNAVFDKKNQNNCFRPFFSNGYYDYNTGELKPIIKDDYCLKIFPQEYHPDIICKELKKFMKEILPEQSHRDYLWKCISNSLLMDNENLHNFFGTGKNGKSKFVRIIDFFWGTFWPYQQ